MIVFFARQIFFFFSSSLFCFVNPSHQTPPAPRHPPYGPDDWREPLLLYLPVPPVGGGTEVATVHQRGNAIIAAVALNLKEEKKGSNEALRE